MLSRTTFVCPVGLLCALAVLGAGCGDDTAPSSPAPCGGSGTICTWAGTGERSFNGDGRSLADTSFYWPMDLEIAPDGRAYVLDWQNHRVRRVNADGRVQTVIGTDFVGDGPPDGSDATAAGAPGTKVELNHPTDIQFFADGTLLLAAWHNHKLRRFDPVTGRVTVICGGAAGDRGDFGLASRAQLNQPKAIAIDPSGDIYVADSRNQRIRRIQADSQMITTVAGSGKKGFGGDGGDPLRADFYMQLVDENPEPGGGIALDATGRLYVADTFNNRIRRIDFSASTVETIAGTGVPGFGGDGGPATQALLMRPRDIEFGADGRLYIADTDNHRVRAVDLATGTIATVAGGGMGAGGAGGDGGRATAAQLQRPFGIAFDGAGNLYIADTFNSRIRKVVR